jgi:hypothetical protein
VATPIISRLRLKWTHIASKAFEVHQDAQKEVRLVRENAQLKTLIGELTLELKKATSGWAEPATFTPGRTSQ